jgi:hypothetical protein
MKPARVDGSERGAVQTSPLARLHVGRPCFIAGLLFKLKSAFGSLFFNLPIAMNKVHSLNTRTSWSLLLAAGLLGTTAIGAQANARSASAALASAADERFDLKVEAGPAKAGKPAVVKVTVTAKSPWHLNMDFPTSLKFQASDGLKLAKDALKKADAATMGEGAISFNVEVVADQPGSKTLNGTFKFAICKAEACAPVTQAVSATISVTK